MRIPQFIRSRAIPRSAILRRGPVLEEKLVALTFDDGPKEDHTDRVLDWLAEFGWQATFFVVGRRAELYPDLLRRMLSLGCEIGNHSYSHRNFRHLAGREVRREIDLADTAVLKATNQLPRWIRPPFGAWTPGTIWRTFVTRRNPVILWSAALGGDESINDRSPDQIMSDLRDSTVASGDIFLLHDDNANTVTAVPQILRHLRDLGFRGVTLSELLGHADHGKKRGASSSA